MQEMTGFWQASLLQMIETLGEAVVKEQLSSFSCPANLDVQDFLWNKAISFAKQGIAATHLVYTSYQGKPVLVGYYALANKTYVIRNIDKYSTTLRKRLRKFAKYNEDLRQYEIPMPLIGQLGKNYANGYDRLIDGGELLNLAFERIKMMQMCVGGKLAYLECAPIEGLMRFYEENGFKRMAIRELSAGEIGLDEHKSYMQMIKYF